MANLGPALLQKMVSVSVGRFRRRCAIVELLFAATACDSMIFHPGKFPGPPRDRPEMLEWKIETDVAIKFAIGWIARIAFVCAPNLAARIAIAGEGGRACGRKNRRVDGVA